MRTPLHRPLAVLWTFLALPALSGELVQVVREFTAKVMQCAIDAWAARGGGVAYLPPGRYVTGPLWLKDNVEFRLEPGSTLVLSPDKKDWPAGVRALISANQLVS
jgi:polygalacturonase